MRSWKKVLLTAACGAMAATTLVACGGGSGSGAGDDATFTMWLYSSVDSSYYTDYADVLSGMIADAPKNMLANGIAMDLTDYVSFIEEAAKLGKPLVGVHFDGRPISSDVADDL